MYKGKLNSKLNLGVKVAAHPWTTIEMDGRLVSYLTSCSTEEAKRHEIDENIALRLLKVPNIIYRSLFCNRKSNNCENLDTDPS